MASPLAQAVLPGAKRAVPPGTPQLRLLFWEATAGCNLSCVHCRRLDVSRELMRDDLSTEEARRFIDQVAECGSPILVLSGGEPLMRPDIFELAFHARQRGLPVSLATNGTLVDEETAARIAAAGIRRVAVSLDGADAETHDTFRRQPGSFQAALRAIRLLKRAGVPVQVNATLTRHNAHQREAIHRLAVDLGAEALHLFLLVPVGCGAQIEESHQLEAQAYEEVLHWAVDKARGGPIHVRPICAPHYFRVLHQRAKQEGWRVDRGRSPFESLTRGCLAANSIAFVSHNGEVFPCGYLPLTAGNIQTTPLRDIWENSGVLQGFRDPARLGGKCGACEYRNLCLGCRARAWFATGDPMAEEPYCIYQPPSSARPEPSR